MLKIEKINKKFGGLHAIKNLSFTIEKGPISAIIGPNGAGKTTVFNLLTGVFKVDSCKIFFEDRDITNFQSYQIARLGITRTFQNLQIFTNMTVLENIMTGFYLKSKQNLFHSMFRLNLKEEKFIREKSLELLDILNLTQYANSDTKILPFGILRQVEIVRALASSPKLILMDEPAAGLNTFETDILAENIKKIKDLGVTILLIEHDMNLVMKICEKIIVLNFGEKIAEGKAEEIQKDERVIKAYLGE